MMRHLVVLLLLLPWTSAGATAQTPSSTIPPGPTVSVYGGQYHLATCPRLAGHTPQTMPLADALRAGAGPCEVCRPNVVDQAIGAFAAEYVVAIAREKGGQAEPPPEIEPPLTFREQAGLIMVRVRRGAEASFEQGLGDLKVALANVPSRRSQAQGWMAYRAVEPMAGDTLYMFLFDPAVPGADYNLINVLNEGLRQNEAVLALQRFTGSLASSMNLLNLQLVQQMDLAAPTLPPSTTTLPPVAQRSIGIPTLGEATPRIRSKCAADWPDDFRMRAYCQEQQTTALQKLQTRSMTTTDQLIIRRKCLTDWPDDFKMEDYCEEQQLKALASIR